MRDLLRPLPSAALVGLLAALVHVPGLAGGFVYDDWMLLADNPHVHSIARPSRFFTDPETLSQHGALHSYRPIRTLLLAVEWQLFGDRPGGYHAVSIALHVAVALVLLLLLRRWTGSPKGALLAAALFAVHPVTTEAVAWISIQGALVSTGALLAALLVLDRPRPGRIAAGCLLFLLSAGAKESGVVLPILLLVRSLWLPRAPAPGRRWAASLLVLAGLAIAYVVTRQVLVTVVASETAAHRVFYGGSRLATLGAFLSGTVYYAGSILLPVELTLRWSPPAPPQGAGQILLLAAGVALVAGTVVLGLALRRRRPLLAAGLMMALASLGPASSFLVPLPLVTELRYLYPALPFLALAVAPVLDRRTAWLAVILVLLLAALSVRRTPDWSSDVALWESALRRPRSTPEALGNLGFARLRQAIEAYRSFRETDEIHHLLAARALLLANVEERELTPELVDDNERSRQGGLLEDVAARLLELGRPGEALEPAAVSAAFGGPTVRRLLLRAAALEALGRREEAEAARREAARLE